MLSDKQINIIIEVLKPYDPSKIGIFGSFARGQEAPTSDIDILYSFTKPLTLFKIVRIQDELERKLAKSVDLVSEKAIHPMLRDNIYKDLKLIYGHE